MAEFKTYAPGTFCWVDLATTDTAGAKAFYGDLFGWSITDVPAGEAGTYTMLGKNGKNVCALYQMLPAQQQQGVPPHWLSYVSVADVDASATKATALGATVLQSPCDVMDSGRMSLLQDPTGAIFALWQPQAHIGADLANEPATLCWNELQTNDIAKASQFYAELFGWTTTTSTNAMGGNYTEFLNGDRSMGGMLEIQPEWGEVPPNWVVYFAVENCDATLERVQALGGKIEMQPIELPDVGRFAIVQDPQGAFFTVIQLAPGVN
ncbi:MAG: VOC family protein [Cyanobacteria bacterium P01_H01_bin.121]